MPKPPQGETLRVLILADFVGASRPSWLLRKVDPGNLDGLVAAVAPRLCLRDLVRPGQAFELAFSCLDDFHPDELFHRLSSLKNLETAPLATSGSGSFGGAVTAPVAATPVDSLNPVNPGSLLSSLLGGEVVKPAPAQQSADQVVETLIRSAVAPHVTALPTAEQSASIAAADAWMANCMRRVLNDPAFVRLEAAWRALERLVASLPSDAHVEFWISAHAPQTLADDLVANEGSLDESLLAKTLQPSAAPAFSLVALDGAFGGSIDSLLSLGAFAAVVAGAGASFVAGADPALTAAEPGLAETWDLLRQSPLAPHVALAGPRWLLRLPYGPRRNEVQAFAFDELAGAQPEPSRFLWGGAAFAVVEALAVAFAEDAEDLPLGHAATLGDIPIFTFQNEHGEKQIYPATGDWMAEHQTHNMLAAGVIPLVAHRDRALVTLVRLQSIAQPPAALHLPRAGG